MFTGFTPETVDFLWGIRMNNNRDWFLAHKEQYVKELYEPMKALAAELYEPFKDHSGSICKVSRIYKDARMHPELPYKESLCLWVRQDVDWWAENPCLFFEIRPEGYSYGFSLWRPRTSTMEQFRQVIAAKPEEFLQLMANAQAQTGMAVVADTYKRPKPCADPRLEPYFAWRTDICCFRREEFSEASFGPALGQKVGQFFTQLAPVYHWFCQFRV